MSEGQMAKKNPQLSIEKWKRSMANAAESLKQGVQGVTEAPGAKAAAASDKYLRGVTEAANSGKFARNAAAVPLQDWQASMLGKGVTNMANGARTLDNRAMRAMQNQLEEASRISSVIAGMPNNSEADADARMLAAARMMREYGKR